MPWMTNIVPRVASMSGIFMTTISRALRSPASAPAAMTARIATVPTWLYVTIVFAATVTPSPATAPTDMSMPPTAMVTVTPRPRIAATETYRRVSSMVADSRKEPSLSAK